MIQFYLVKEENQYYESGTLIKLENKCLFSIDQSTIKTLTECDIIDFCIELSELKMNYLLKRDLKKRLGIHNSKLFEKIEQLKANDECYVIDRKYRERCTIIEKKRCNNQYIVKTKDNKEKVVSIFDIDLIVNIEYFICLRQYGGIAPGTIIVEEDQMRKTFPDGYFVCNYIDQLDLIPREKATFLVKYPCDERLKIHTDQLWESIDQLKERDQCCLVSTLEHPSYVIIGRKSFDGGVEYIVQAKADYIVSVDQTDVRPSPLGGSHNRGTDQINADRPDYLSTRPPLLCNVVSYDEQSLRTKTKYFECTIIDPRSMVTIEIQPFDDWILDTGVEFVLGESYKMYHGLLKWTGLINKVKCAAINVGVIESNDLIIDFLCSEEILIQMDVFEMDHNNIVIVLMSTLSRSQTSNEREYMSRVVKFIDKRDLHTDILMYLVDEEDMRVLNFIAKQWRHPIPLNHYPNLLPKLIRQDNYDVIRMLLDDFIKSDNQDIHLLNAAKYFLLMEDQHTFVKACKKCTNPDIILANGQTFLTDILNETIDEVVINRAIGSNIFDVNQTNEINDSPLVLACGKLLVSTVRLMLTHGAMASCQNNRALQTVTDLRKMISDTNQLQRALEIISMFVNDIPLDCYLCPICIHRPINTALNCGHTMCEACSKDFQRCPNCNIIVLERKRIFLS